MSDEVLVWECASLPGETGKQAAERFIREMFTTERAIRWCVDDPNLFFFADAYWCYRLEMVAGGWRVYRTNKPTRAAKARARARREAKR